MLSEKKFLELIDGFEIRELNGFMFCFNGDNLLFEIDLEKIGLTAKQTYIYTRFSQKKLDFKNEYLYWSNENVWTFFEEETHEMLCKKATSFEKYNKISIFLNQMIEKHFNFIGVNSESIAEFQSEWHTMVNHGLKKITKPHLENIVKEQIQDIIQNY